MLLMTNSYVVPKEKRAEHARLVRKFRQTLGRLGCDQFDVFEQVASNWGGGETTGRFVQMMRFRDRKHQVAVQTAEKQDPSAQALIAEFCELINFPYQQQQGLFAVGYYQSVLPVAPARAAGGMRMVQEEEIAAEGESVDFDAAADAGGEVAQTPAGLRIVEDDAAADEVAAVEAVDVHHADEDAFATHVADEDAGDASSDAADAKDAARDDLARDDAIAEAALADEPSVDDLAEADLTDAIDVPDADRDESPPPSRRR